MLSGWLVEFKDGNKIILDEECYAEYEKTDDRKNARCEAHWFSLKDLIEKNLQSNQEIKQRFIKEYNYKKLKSEGMKENE